MATVIILVNNKDARGIVAAVLREMGLRKKFSYLSRREVSEAASVPKAHASPRFIGYEIDEKTAQTLATAVLAAAGIGNMSKAVDVYVD